MQAFSYSLLTKSVSWRDAEKRRGYFTKMNSSAYVGTAGFIFVKSEYQPRKFDVFGAGLHLVWNRERQGTGPYNTI